MPLQLEDLASLDDVLSSGTSAEPNSTGAPLLIAIDLIDEDPAQPRVEFDAESLNELAATITARGVRQPISVRRHPADVDRWMLNFGARRLRAARLVGLTEIPAFVDETADSYDQVIENEQRQGLTPLELAFFLQRRVNAGESQAEIARRIGKSSGYLSFARALIDAPDWLMDLYRNGRCRGLTEIYELRKLQSEHPSALEHFRADTDPITRDRIAAMRASLQHQRLAAENLKAVRQIGEGGFPSSSTTSEPSLVPKCDTVPSSGARPVRRLARPQTAISASSALALSASTPPPPPRLFVELDGTTFELIIDRMPADATEVFVIAVGGQAMAVKAVALRLLGFCPGSSR
jgi:ParB family chromosome partitioning protein